MLRKLIGIVAVAAVVVGCKTPKPIELPEQTIEIENPFKIPERPVYNASETKKFDLIHTKLDVRFNWEKAHLYGKAEVTLTPYFYPQQTLELDARGMDIAQVKLMVPPANGELIATRQDLKYDYDSLKLNIHLDKTYTRKDTLTLYVEYTAKPNELQNGGSAAITDDKGLYFINEKGEDKEKPMQIWTQGETQSNSAWFPTIDVPNQRMTNEIAITIEDKYETLSNGTLMRSELNGDGTRTDYWEMNLPHAPYLVMMAIGDYAVVKDKWRNIDVEYYVEHDYEPYAKDIFGLTPEMLEFYSTKLGVDYPWQKYSQIIVRDYVSGAMENTSAVIHGDFVQQTKRELIDGSAGEDVIAHELFHHWFGDLVTCESWANLPLNESFATYGEVLWREYKYGDDKAAEGLQNDLNSYLQSVKRGAHKQMVRFGYEDREDMFDRHTYQKGGRILHMLRNYMGDDAFFASLKLYLDENKYTDVEMHQLRMACEKVTGEDLNWFFNQWFYDKGHPILEITYDYNDSLKQAVVAVSQMQDYREFPIYKLPVKIDVYVDGKVETHEVVIDQLDQEFTFSATSEPQLVNFDADKMLLCEKVDKHTLEEWAFMYEHAPRYLDRYEALVILSESKEDIATAMLVKGLSDKYPRIKRLAISGIKHAAAKKPEEVKSALLKLANTDENPIVRGDAIYALPTYFEKDEAVKEACIKGLAEESYYVISSSLESLAEVSYEDALKFAKTLEQDENEDIMYAVCMVYAEHGQAAENQYFLGAMDKVKGYKVYGLVSLYAKYLKKQNNETISSALPAITRVAKEEDAWWVRMVGINTLMDFEDMYKNRIHVAELELKDLKPGDDKELDLRNAIDSDTGMKKKIEAIMNDIKETEKDARLLSIINGEMGTGAHD
ncbi:MAG: M1 family peptidase [Flavobacteriales bacterium]|nr:M1 family peptidase [Flavobacteriales bacterium]